MLRRLRPPPAPALSRMARIRLAKSQEVARPEPAASDARETRENAGLREFTEYIKEAAPNDDDPTFTILEYWKPRVTDGLNKSGNVILPARWPHVGLVARLYAGVDATNCQAERNFAALKLTASDLRANMSPARENFVPQAQQAPYPRARADLAGVGCFG